MKIMDNCRMCCQLLRTSFRNRTNYWLFNLLVHSPNQSYQQDTRNARQPSRLPWKSRRQIIPWAVVTTILRLSLLLGAERWKDSSSPVDSSVPRVDRLRSLAATSTKNFLTPFNDFSENVIWIFRTQNSLPQTRQNHAKLKCKQNSAYVFSIILSHYHVLICF